MKPWWFVLDALAAYRLTRLVTADYITHTPRQWVLRWAHRRGPKVEDYVGTFVECPWCVGVWVAAFITVARWVAPGVWTPVAYGLAVAAVAAVVQVLVNVVSDE